MPDRRLIVNLKLWNFTGLLSFTPSSSFISLFSLYLGRTNVSYKAINGNRNGCGHGVP